MAKWDLRVEALKLLRRHPGWSDRRIAASLGLSNNTVSRWRREEGLAIYTRRVGEQRRRVEYRRVSVGEALGRLFRDRAGSE